MADDFPRIDVLSFKGGVGKTTVSWQLARHIAEQEKGPVLLIDADLTGTSLGEFLFPSHPWHQELNLAHLLVMEPERLPETLRDRPPVREFSSLAQQSDRLTPPADVLLCQSHALSSERIELEILHALLAQESVGGWVHHVISLIAKSVHKRWPLKALIVDHSPGIGNLQEKVILDARSSKVFVTSLDLPDVQMVYRYLLSAQNLDEQTCFVFNKIPLADGAKSTLGLPKVDEWTSLITKLPNSEEFFKRSVSLPDTQDVQNALRTQGAASLKHFKEQLGQIWSWTQEPRGQVVR